jgi:hypothetical protein
VDGLKAREVGGMDWLKRGYKVDGFYRGKVVENRDPLQLGRVKVKVYPWFEEVRDEDCPWAEPAWQGGMLYVPPVNAWVWVFFEGGDVEKPVWFAWSLPFNNVRFKVGSVWEEFGEGVMDAKGMYEEQGAEYPGAVVWRMPMGSSLVFYASGRIELKNRVGAKLVLHEDGAVRLINQSGSEIVINADGTMLIDAKGRRIDINP